MSNDIVETPDVQKIAPLDIPMVNMQVETANKYPRRPLAEIHSELKHQIATVDGLAEQCVYSKPVGKGDDGKQKYVKGPSVRLAELAVAAYGNLLIQVDANDIGDSVKGVCMVFDAQKNIAVKSPVMRAHTSQRPQARQNTYNAAVSIGYRNGTLKVIPKALVEDLWKYAEEVARKGMPEPGAKRGRKKREDKLTKMLEAFAGWEVTGKMLAEYLMIDDIDQATSEQFVELRTLYTAIKDGDADIDSLFNRKPKSGGSKINERTEVLSPEESEEIDKLFG